MNGYVFNEFNPPLPLARLFVEMAKRNTNLPWSQGSAKADRRLGLGDCRPPTPAAGPGSRPPPSLPLPGPTSSYPPVDASAYGAPPGYAAFGGPLPPSGSEYGPPPGSYGGPPPHHPGMLHHPHPYHDRGDGSPYSRKRPRREERHPAGRGEGGGGAFRTSGHLLVQACSISPALSSSNSTTLLVPAGQQQRYPLPTQYPRQRLRGDGV